ncbi:hypothetical protein KZO01_04550 [Kurthia zopfii]|uniref:PH (Pleckstrin Homology) domain-containing protein n=1 Tax=Kurthia zopfii TaxID=1650 RepID=A0A2U3AGH6_9BACL|nr:PH domain-containing protein [Kurthia zopfii]PWI23646.1 hypothetical protein DF281_02075 [Kurthia zopfii]TDR42673.1 PH (Pleckstrin Homology) domain-containing protein [Kurthia zopfii]STX10490.1 Uncharacterised protein [Kurthia zopfii]VEI06135.1 Uncharacterised protein [Kurthia zopfii]GEK30146.1 hypothetical protein KZO01_04550 [Kurthia zopfii]
MENLKIALDRMNPYLNRGERIQSSLLGMFNFATSTPQKGILYATNERICLFSEENFSVLDYYKIDAIESDEMISNELTLHYGGQIHKISLIEEGDTLAFNHFVLDRMEIKS